MALSKTWLERVLASSSTGPLAGTAKAAYAAWFIENQDPGTPASLGRILQKLDCDPAAAIAQANSEEIREKYAAETEVARSLGIFGSPTFAYGTEIFWGDDRLEDAIDWCSSH